LAQGIQRSRRLALLSAIVLSLTIALPALANDDHHHKPKPNPVVNVQVLAFDDFHGYLEANPAPGVEQLATSLAMLRQGHKNTITAAAGGTTVTMPSNAWSPTVNPGDWLVVRVAPGVPTSASSTMPIQSVVDVSARWALAGGDVHQFEQPLDIALANSTGTVPATFENSAWRLLRWHWYPSACSAP